MTTAESSVVDRWHFGTDPDPRIRTCDKRIRMRIQEAQNIRIVLMRIRIHNTDRNNAITTHNGTYNLFSCKFILILIQNHILWCACFIIFEEAGPSLVEYGSSDNQPVLARGLASLRLLPVHSMITILQSCSHTMVDKNYTVLGMLRKR
jgi:hypothetical protein